MSESTTMPGPDPIPAPAKPQEPKKGVQTVHIDGALYVAIGFLTAVYTSLTSDDAAKFASTDVLFWSKLSVGGLNAGFLALKMYRSTAFAESKQT